MDEISSFPVSHLDITDFRGKTVKYGAGVLAFPRKAIDTLERLLCVHSSFCKIQLCLITPNFDCTKSQFVNQLLISQFLICSFIQI